MSSEKTLQHPPPLPHQLEHLAKVIEGLTQLRQTHIEKGDTVEAEKVQKQMIQMAREFTTLRLKYESE